MADVQRTGRFRLRRPRPRANPLTLTATGRREVARSGTFTRRAPHLWRAGRSTRLVPHLTFAAEWKSIIRRSRPEPRFRRGVVARPPKLTFNGRMTEAAERRRAAGTAQAREVF